MTILSLRFFIFFFLLIPVFSSAQAGKYSNQEAEQLLLGKWGVKDLLILAEMEEMTPEQKATYDSSMNELEKSIVIEFRRDSVMLFTGGDTTNQLMKWWVGEKGGVLYSLEPDKEIDQLKILYFNRNSIALVKEQELRLLMYRKEE